MRNCQGLLLNRNCGGNLRGMWHAPPPELGVHPRTQIYVHGAMEVVCPVCPARSFFWPRLAPQRVFESESAHESKPSPIRKMGMSKKRGARPRSARSSCVCGLRQDLPQTAGGGEDKGERATEHCHHPQAENRAENGSQWIPPPRSFHPPREVVRRGAMGSCQGSCPAEVFR